MIVGVQQLPSSTYKVRVRIHIQQRTKKKSKNTQKKRDQTSFPWTDSSCNAAKPFSLPPVLSSSAAHQTSSSNPSRSCKRLWETVPGANYPFSNLEALPRITSEIVTPFKTTFP